MLFLSRKKLLVGCVALAVLAGSSTARAATIVPDAFPYHSVTVGNPLEVWLWFYRFGGSGPEEYLESFYGQLYYDATRLRPQRVTFSYELGSPDRSSYFFDEASGEFVADAFGTGDATTLVSHHPAFQFPFPPPQPGQGVIRMGEWSFIFNELFEPNGFPAVRMTFETLQPGTAAFTWVYEMNRRAPYSSAGSAEITPAPVPEPSTFFMMLAGVPWLVSRLRQHAQRPR